MVVRRMAPGWWLPLVVIVGVLAYGVHASLERGRTPARVGPTAAGDAEQPPTEQPLPEEHPPVRRVGQWNVMEVARGPGVAAYIRVRRRASPAMEHWLELELVNRTGQPMKVQHLQFWMNYELEGMSSGSLISGHEADVLPPGAGERYPHAFTLPAGRLRLHGNLSMRASADLPIIPEGERTLRIQTGLSLETEHGGCSYGPPHIQRGNVPWIESTWLRPNEAGLRALRERLEAALASSAVDQAKGYRENSWLRKPEIGGDLSLKMLLEAADLRSGNDRRLLLTEVGRRFSDDPDVRRYLLARIDAGDATVVADLGAVARAHRGGIRQSHLATLTYAVLLHIEGDEPTDEEHERLVADEARQRKAERREAARKQRAWLAPYVEPLLRWAATGDLARRMAVVRLFAYEGSPQSDDPALAARLGRLLTDGGILDDRVRSGGRVDPPDQHRFEVLGLTRDRGSVSHVTPFLGDPREISSLRGWPETWSITSFQAPNPPPPRRVCDVALYAVWALLCRDPYETFHAKALRYHQEFPGFDVQEEATPEQRLAVMRDQHKRNAVHAARMRYLDGLRDGMIADLKAELAK